MAKQPSITSLPVSPEDDRRARMIKYSITMGIRLVCIIACFFVRGAWIILPAVGAIVLPYVAVVLANVSNARTSAVLRPGQFALPPARNADQDLPETDQHLPAAETPPLDPDPDPDQQDERTEGGDQ